MDASIELMLQKYQAENIYDRKNAVKEIMQEIVLCGLARADFFKQAAFFGGTALRIFYGLDRFSEDLDFSLITPDPEFKLADYLPTLEKEVRSFGLNIKVEEKQKTKDSNIRSAFLKGNTKEHLLFFYADDRLSGGVAKNETIKIKIEIDTNPPGLANFEHKYRLLPSPYEIKLYDMPSLFAGKLHAVICRAWKGRVKGRDLYDYIFYLSSSTPVNRLHLRQRLIESNFISDESECSLEDVKKMLIERFDSINYTQAKQDVEPFIRDTAKLDIWSADFFKQITNELTEIN